MVTIEDLKTSRIFENLDGTSLQTFCDEAQIKKVSKKNLIFSQDDKAGYFYIVKEGGVKIFRETPAGEEIVVDIVGAGDAFGEVAIFNGGQQAYSAESVAKSELISLPIKLLESMLDDNTTLAKGLIDKLALQQRKHLSELEHHGHKSAPQRIGCYLLALCPKNHDGEMDVELPYGKTVIAGKLNMKPETFSRSLKALEQDLGIKTAGRVIHIPEVNKLVSYCCSLCSYNYPCDGLR